MKKNKKIGLALSKKVVSNLAVNKLNGGSPYTAGGCHGTQETCLCSMAQTGCGNSQVATCGGGGGGHSQDCGDYTVGSYCKCK